MSEFTINGKEIAISEDRTVWAGKHDDSWYIRFTNKGVEHRLRLSFEAADALVSLLCYYPHIATETMMRFILNLQQETPAARWQQVADSVRPPTPDDSLVLKNDEQSDPVSSPPK